MTQPESLKAESLNQNQTQGLERVATIEMERRARSALSLRSCLPGSLLYGLLERAPVRFSSFHRIAQLRDVWLGPSSVGLDSRKTSQLAVMHARLGSP